jgi:8-oxo-dGTP diphosphatase
VALVDGDSHAVRPLSGARREPSHIYAAGAVIWRCAANGGLQVVLVHRPRYDDWSWPKGKLEGEESSPAAAAREVAEETGLRVRLGIPLPTARYRLSDNVEKTVRYWAARTEGGDVADPPNPAEVDRVEWVDIDEARVRLSRRADRFQIDALIAAHEVGELDTVPFIVVRHGFARPRNLWAREDAERPRVEAGRIQAGHLHDTLTAWVPQRVFTSPWRRCQETIRPFVSVSMVKVRNKAKLSEDGHRRNRAGTAALISKQLGRGRSTVICTHRPVLGTILGVLAGHAAAGRSGDLPRKDPFLAPGEVLVAHVQRGSARVVVVERHLTSANPAALPVM